MIFNMRLAFVAIALFFAGCDQPFESEQEELLYLQSLSNPSPSQWKRRTALSEKAKNRDEERTLASNKKKAASLYSRAMNAMEEGRDDEAIDLFYETWALLPEGNEMHDAALKHRETLMRKTGIIK